MTRALRRVAIPTDTTADMATRKTVQDYGRAINEASDALLDAVTPDVAGRVTEPVRQMITGLFRDSMNIAATEYNLAQGSANVTEWVAIREGVVTGASLYVSPQIAATEHLIFRVKRNGETPGFAQITFEAGEDSYLKEWDVGEFPFDKQDVLEVSLETSNPFTATVSAQVALEVIM